MKQLTRIRLINWHLFENVNISCYGSTYFIGVNGVGKSTILDAIQFALVGGQRDVKYNQAALAGGKRTLTGYVRGELGTEGQRFLRDDATAVVALEFKNPDDTYFVNGAVVDAFQDGRSPNIAYFIVHNAQLSDDWFFRAPGQLFDSRSFRRHLESARIPGGHPRVFTRLEDYRFHLLNRLGQLRENFLDRIVKGIAFSPLTDIRTFVHSYLLDENLVDVTTLQSQLETLRHFESLAADIRERIAALDKIEELDQERLANRRRRLTNGYIQRRAQGDAYLAELKRRRLELDEARLALGRSELQRDELAEQLKRAQTRLIDAQVALQTDMTAARERELRQKIAALEAEIGELEQRQIRLQQALQREVQDAHTLRRFLQKDGRPIPAALQAFIDPASQPSIQLTNQTSWEKGPATDDTSTSSVQARRPAKDFHSPWWSTEHDVSYVTNLVTNITSLQNDLEQLGQAYAREEALLSEQARQLRQEAEQLDRQIVQLRLGNRESSYEDEAPMAARLRQLIRADLQLSEDEVIYLCMALDVPDETWQNAVEGLLASSRFALLVPPDRYDEAMELYRARRKQDRLHGVALLDTERILRQPPTPRPGTLAHEVKSNHPAARAFVDLLLGNTVKVETLEGLRDYRTAVTRECFVRRNFTTSHMNPRVYERWFIGERAIPRQIEQRQARLDEIRGELLGLQEQTSGLQRRLALTRDKARRYVELERDLPALSRLPAARTERDVLLDEVATLDTQTIEMLRAEVGRCQAEVDQRQAETGQLERRLGNLETQVLNLSEMEIPRLEREIDQARQSAQQFLADEGASEMLDDVEVEYERRRDRQPLETILQNAQRYENDYNTAENRSRDRLREDKQAYSLRYDFPYDDEEGAGRYLVERQKFIDSELPRYEERIADQRRLAEQELVENFIHRLREQIEDARQQLAYLNSTLAQLRFGGERFEFTTRPEPSVKQVYDMIMDSQFVLGDSLFESNFRQRHQEGWDLLFERLTAGLHEGDSSELRQLQDYRNYLQYDVRIHYPNGDRAMLSKISAKKSGGETTTPFYVAMAASFAQTYRLTQARQADTIRLALFDEAFSKMDTARTASALQFMNETGLQILLATPPDKSGALLQHVDCVRTVVRKDNHSFVIEMDKAEMLAELEREFEVAF